MVERSVRDAEAAGSNPAIPTAIAPGGEAREQRRILEAKVLIGREKFKTLESDWRRLDARATSSIFQSWDWCDCWLDHNLRAKPLVIIIKRGGEPAAIMPLALSASWLGLPVRRLTFMATGISDYGGWLRAESEADSVRAIANACGDLKFDLLDLHQLTESDARAVATALSETFETEVLDQEPTFSVDLSDSWENYLAGLSKKYRKNTIYADRRLRRDFDFSLLSGADDDRLSGLMESFFRLHQQRWTSRKMPGMFLGRSNRSFHLDMARRLARTGHLVLSLARVDGEPVAAFYGFRHGRTHSYYLGGFDPAWSKYSVSTVLIYNLMHEASKAGCTSFDLLRGEEPYKQKWKAGAVSMHRVLAYRRTARGRAGARIARLENDLVQRARARLHG